MNVVAVNGPVIFLWLAMKQWHQKSITNVAFLLKEKIKNKRFTSEEAYSYKLNFVNTSYIEIIYAAVLQNYFFLSFFD